MSTSSVRVSIIKQRYLRSLGDTPALIARERMPPAEEPITLFVGSLNSGYLSLFFSNYFFYYDLLEKTFDLSSY